MNGSRFKGEKPRMTALESDVDDIQGGTTQEGIHMGVMAGTLDELRAFTFHALGLIRATCLRGGDAEVAYVRAWLYATRYKREGRGREARPAVGHLLGRMEPVAQPATARSVRGKLAVRGVLLALLVTLGRPRPQGCWTGVVRTSENLPSAHSGE